MIMTKFDKELFTWDGMYLMYNGEHTQSKYYELPCHPTRVGTPRSEFIARFKYGSKPWKSWVNFLVKNFTIEEYKALSEQTSPMQAMEVKGFKPRKKRVA
jgi:hypothetical protein